MHFLNLFSFFDISLCSKIAKMSSEYFEAVDIATNRKLSIELIELCVDLCEQDLYDIICKIESILKNMLGQNITEYLDNFDFRTVFVYDTIFGNFKLIHTNNPENYHVELKIGHESLIVKNFTKKEDIISFIELVKLKREAK